MRMQLASDSIVETVVTLAAAALMTFAGFEMLESAPATPGVAAAASTRVGGVAAPHVESSRG